MKGDLVYLPSAYEVNIQVELYRLLKDLVNKGFSFKGIRFTDVKFEQPRINGRPDLTVFAEEKGKEIPILVIETKRRVPWADPFSPEVIAQAERYATWLGAPLFATCNENVFVLFETFKEGVPLPQRKLRDYKVSLDEFFVKKMLEEVGKFRTGVGRWLPLDDVFVQRLRSFHNVIMPYIRRALKDKLRYDDRFKERYIRWLKSQLFEYSDEVNERIVEQMAYILMNRVAFYKTLEVYVSEIPELKKIEAEDGLEFSRILRGYFNKALDVDYEPIFKESIFDEVKIPTPLMYAFNDFIEELKAYNLAKVQSDVLGRVYEELIPAGERHRLGQYYTPPPIVELIIEMCVKSPEDRILDPGCGSGSFLVKAYHKLKDLKRKENPFAVEAQLHEEVLDQIYGIDINQFPAQLAAMNMATRNLQVESKNIHLVVSDFFKVDPSTAVFPPAFDVVVTNPPYTRQEEMEYKGQIRDVALTYLDGSKIDIDARAGIYAYFFTYSAKFLKNEGKMGYITSDTWLDVGFGKGLKRFFLDHFKILAIIWYDVRAFEKPLVGTCITILEKEDVSEQARNENLVKFARIKKALPAEDIVKSVEMTAVNFEDERMGVVLKKQKELQPEEKWGTYIRAPPIYFKVIQHPKMIRFKDIAKIRRGFTTGANQFFYFDKEKIRLWNIESEYLEPLVTSPKDVNVEIRPQDIKQWVLMVHEPKEELLKKNANVSKYIEWGENTETKIKGGRRGGATVKGYHNLSTLKSRKIWYDLGKREPAPLLFSCKIWERCIYAQNTAKVQADKAFYEVRPLAKEDITVLAGILNSSITALLCELQGRFYGGGVLELEVYESKQLPVLDPSKLSKVDRKQIEQSFVELCVAQRRGDKRAEEEAQAKLDNVVFDILELTENERKQVYEGLESLRQMRFQRKEVEVLIETAERWKHPRKVKRKRRVREREPSKRLDLWIQD